MPLVLMSNPGLHLALLGNPRRRKVKAPRGFKSRKAALSAVARARRRVGRRFKIKGGGTYRVDKLVSYRARTGRPRIHAKGIAWSGRKGGAKYRAVIKRRGQRKVSTTLTNPLGSPMSIIRGYVSALKGAPGTVTSTIGRKDRLKALGFLAIGAAGAYVASGAVVGLSKRIPGVGTVANNAIGARVLGLLGNFTVGYLASKFIKGPNGQAILAGSIVSGLVEAVAPGQMDRVIGMIPGIGPTLRGAKLSGLYGFDGYVSAPSYQGVGGYVSAPSYQGVGGYVSAPSYQGVGDAEDALAADAADELAGNDDGSDELDGPDDLAGMGNYLAESGHYMQPYFNSVH
jgi:hypothetical protein